MSALFVLEHSVLGYLVLQGSQKEGIVALDFTASPPPHRLTDDPLVLAAAGKLKRYLRGDPVNFGDIPVAMHGTPFQVAVWNALREIPWGQTRSYGWVAQRVGSPGASRAVGQANGRNPVPIIVPCHRVIQHNGALGGFTGGLTIKRFLLELESGRQTDLSESLDAQLALAEAETIMLI